MKVNLDFSDIILEESSLQQTPNKFLINNLILNNSDALHLVAGENFDGYENIEAVGDDNIFLNHFFMNEYYKNDYLRWMLTLFDVALYNRDEYIADAIVFIPKAVINSVGSDTAKNTANAILKNMSVKRYEGAINSILSSDYTSSSKKTFGYEKSKYNFLNCLQEGTSTTNKLISNFGNGTEKLVEGIEDYQSWYFNDIMPKYSNASNNLLKMNEYLITNAKNMDHNSLTEYTEYLRKYSSEVTKYETLEFAYDKASTWKFNLEKSYYAKEASNTLEKAGKILSVADGTLNMLKTWNQVNENEEILKDTFSRLYSQTNDKNLKLVLNDYMQKMDNDCGNFILSSFSNIYNTLLKNKVEKTINQKITDAASHVIADNWGAYTVYATDKALSKANYLLLAADAGAFFAEQISSTETLLEKSVEIKYLWKLENYSKEVLQNDINEYKINQSEENARNILNDLLWIKSIKLRAITVTNELYQANGDSKYISLFEDDSEIYEYINSVFENQKDALINTSLIEGVYSSEPLKIESGETYITFDRNNLSHDAAIIKNNTTKTFSGGAKRLTGGIELCNWGSLLINNQNESVYIPYLHLTGGTFTVSGKNIVIGELIFESGNVNISKDSKVTVLGDVIQTGGILNIGNGVLQINNTYHHIGGTYNAGVSGQTIVKGNYTSRTVDDAEGGYASFVMNNDDAYMLVNGDFYMGSMLENLNIKSGTLELKGDFYQHEHPNWQQGTIRNFQCSGTHKVILSGETEQKIYFERPYDSYFNILINKNEKNTLDNRCYKHLFTEIPYIVQFVTNTDKGTIVKILDSTIENSLKNHTNLLELPVMQGYDLKNWYFDKDYTIPLTAQSDTITSDVILYAKWVEPIKFNNAVYSIENNTISVSVLIEEEIHEQNGITIIAIYNDEELVDIYYTNSSEIVSHIFENIPIRENGYTVKAFCWSDFETIIPLCEAISTTIQ